jgi:outer membrane immunogenic protein
MNMRIWGVAGLIAGAAAFGVSAQAADLGAHHHETYKEEPVYVAPTWSGFYFGGHLGAGWTSGTADQTTNYYNSATGATFTESVSKDIGSSSFIGGIHGGYNFQSGAFVYGIEGDGSWGHSINYLASVRARFGVAANNWLFFGTAGVGFSGQNFNGDVSDQYGTAWHYDQKTDQTGFVVGGGAEVKVTPNLSLGVEGLYYGFDGKTVTLDDGAGSQLKTDIGSDVGVVRGRLTYHFGGGGRAYEPLK